MQSYGATVEMHCKMTVDLHPVEKNIMKHALQKKANPVHHMGDLACFKAGMKTILIFEPQSGGHRANFFQGLEEWDSFMLGTCGLAGWCFLARIFVFVCAVKGACWYGYWNSAI